MKKVIIFMLAIMALLFLGNLWYQYYYKSDNIANIYISNKTRQVEEAITDEQKIVWLMNRTHIDDNGGMIFVRSGDLLRNFWMKDTMIPLDIIYINSWYNIVNIKTGIPYDLTPLSSEKPAKYVLEINWWQAAKYNINIWDKVKIY